MLWLGMLLSAHRLLGMLSVKLILAALDATVAFERIACRLKTSSVSVMDRCSRGSISLCPGMPTDDRCSALSSSMIDSVLFPYQPS